MDIILERILSLIPKKDDGKFVHGSKKDFADSLNLSHNLVTMWEKGQSSSYKNYLYEISAKYNVSTEWLLGKTDQKEKLATENGSELDLAARELMNVGWADLNQSNQEVVRDLIASLLKQQSFEE